MRRLLVPSTALLWGLQFSFLNPVLALLLVALYHAGAAEVGGVLGLYNAGGFVASLVLPAYADRTHDYLRPMLLCGVLTLGLAVLLAAVTSLPLVVLGLLVLGGPAGVGSSLLFAHLKDSGAGPQQVVNTRAIFSLAWVAGPPVATVVMATFGDRAILVAIAAVAACTVATTGAVLVRGPAPAPEPGDGTPEPTADPPVSRARIALIVAVFVALQATNSAAVSVMSLFVTRTLGLDVRWAGAALGVAAGLEVPALLLIGRLTHRVPSMVLVASGCVAGIAYYAGMAFVSGPFPLIGLQVLNAWFFAVVAGVGMTLFQSVVPRPGLASGLYTNTRRLGAIVSGPVIGFGSATALGYGGIFAACAALTAVALALVGVVGRLA